MRRLLDQMAKEGVRHVVTFIDATPDVGLTAMEVAVNLREEYRREEKLELEIVVHPIFGFKTDSDYKQSRQEVFEEAAQIADIVGGLPEKDDRPDSIGFDGHIRLVLELGHKLNKPVHIHLDQDNDLRQHQTLDFIQAVRWLGSPKVPGVSGPTVWVVHAISPSAYPEGQFLEVLEGLKRYNIGVVCCPRAALSMRQLRSQNTPTHNSVARVLEMALWGVSVRLGTDNLSDIYVPTYRSMLEEVCTLADTIRFYDPGVLAKFAAGVELNRTDEEIVRTHLEDERKALVSVNPHFVSCIHNDS